MSTGPTHFAAAESLLASGRGISADDLEPAQLLAAVIAEAQVHATLALAAASAFAAGRHMPAPDSAAWYAAIGELTQDDEEETDPSVVWWLDDGGENPGPPELHVTEIAARAAAVERYCQDNPLSDPDSDQVDWALPEDEGDATDDAELLIRGKRTGIFVRPVRPKDGA